MRVDRCARQGRAYGSTVGCVPPANETAFLEAVTWSAAILRRDEIRQHWNEPSALRRMTVGAVAGHLFLAMRLVDRCLDAPRPDDDPGIARPSFVQAYARLHVPDDSALDEPANAAVRADGEHVAATGWATVVERYERYSAKLATRLPKYSGSEGLVLGVGSCTLDQLLQSRVVEVLVHGDDLAVSASLQAPPPPERAAEVAIAFLVASARVIHGDVALLRGLTCRERADPNGLLVF